MSMEWTDEVMEKEAQKILCEAREDFLREGTLHATAIVFGNVNASTGKTERKRLMLDTDEALVAPEAVTDDERKDVATRVVAVIAEQTKASAIIWMMEAWLLMREDVSKPEEWYGRYEKHPKRKEAIMVTMESYAASMVQWVAIIERTAGKPVQLGEWDKRVSTREHRLQGRFLDLLPSVN